MPHPAPLRLLRPAELHPRSANRPPLARAVAHPSRALISDHLVDAAINAAHVDLYDRPIVRAGAGKAHRARGTYSRMMAESVAAFLAAGAAR